MKKITLMLTALFALTFFGFFTINPLTETDYFDTAFLKKTKEVQKALAKEGFFEIDYKTEDGININAVMLDQSRVKNIKATIIFASGYFPGTKEGMASFYEMLKDQPYNFIFFDARGHGKSTGEHITYSAIKEYTQHEYKDVLATLEFASLYNERNNLPNQLIMYGLCSGAFHTIKAMSHLEKSNSKILKNIRGVVFDSGWPSFADVVESSLQSEMEKRFNHWATYLIGQFSAYAIIFIYNLFFKTHHLKQETIINDMKKITQPIFFIHAKNDTFIPINLVEKLIQIAPNAQTWIIEESTHACHHLKHKEAYKDKFIRFLNNITI